VAETIYQAFAETAQRFPGRPALLHKVQGRYRTITFQELSQTIDAVAAGLAEHGVGPGTAVGIYSYNRPEWVISDLAVIKLGGVVVPVYHTLPDETVRYILCDAAVTRLFVETPELLATVSRVLPAVPALKEIITFFDPPAESPTGKKLFSLEALRQVGVKALTTTPLRARAHAAAPDDLVTVCYTSGTTGEPKGAMLTHRNIMANVTGAIKRFGITEHDVLLSFLPLCHMFERTCGYYTMLLAGAAIGYAESVQTIREDIQAVRPTLLIVVPRVLEKVYNAVAEKVLTGPALSRRLMIATLRTYRQSGRLRARHQPLPLGLRLKHRLLGLLVVRKLKQLGGGRIRLLVSGSAPLEPRLARTIRSLGFNLLEGYGLTETAPVVCAAVPGEERVGTVGKPFPGVEVRIGPNDEILVRGPNVMKGYLNKPAETQKTIDAEGWLHTGDQGRFDQFGNLIITGRIKELIVTAYGKNIAPVPIEQALGASQFVEQTVVIGDRRPFLTALIVPRRIPLEDYGRKHGISFTDFTSLLADPAISTLFREEIKLALARFAPYEQVRDFRLIPEPFTVENGLLTPTMKIRRPVVARVYHELIESMYQGH